MNNDKDKLLKQVDIDTLFFFLTLIASLISLYLINEKKKSILNIDCITNEKANEIYKYNRILKFIIAGYFFLNAYYSNKNTKDIENKKQTELLVIATLFLLIGSALYLPLGNSNLIIEN